MVRGCGDMDTRHGKSSCPLGISGEIVRGWRRREVVVRRLMEMKTDNDGFVDTTDDDDDEYKEVEEEESLPRVSDFVRGVPATKRNGGEWREGFRLFKAVSGIEAKLIACFVPFDVVMDSGGVAQSGLGVMFILVNGDRFWSSWFDDNDDDDDDDDGFC
ncbi:hypothetical protein LWI28_019825 [Acer negundo]|uniref:Uncharacterized protein n=1 Tax=Acer negundo TaxID=4023 RepID=A0AAD5NV34_ACENE|nr:hypothetical protein LWI28_019825 [Acer negundo]